MRIIMNNREIKKFFISILVIPVILTGVLSAQMSGGSMSPPGNSWGIGVSLDVNSFELENYSYSSFRPMSKVFFALGEFIDLAVFLGSSNMNVDYPAAMNLKRFKSELDIAGGVSAKLRIPLPLTKKSRLLFCEAGYFRTEYDGERRSSLSVAQSGIYQKFLLGQYYVNAGIIIRTRTIDYYAGWQGSKYRQEETLTYVNYESEVMNSAIAGLDFKLQDNWVINMQFRAINGGTISLGVSQYGFYR